jgi:hypothetical protein
MKTVKNAENGNIENIAEFHKASDSMTKRNNSVRKLESNAAYNFTQEFIWYKQRHNRVTLNRRYIQMRRMELIYGKFSLYKFSSIVLEAISLLKPSLIRFWNQPVLSKEYNVSLFYKNNGNT